MLLPFKEQFPDGSNTHFLVKIWTSLRVQEKFTYEEHKKYYDAYIKKFGKDWGCDKTDLNPKNHSIRLDIHNRWSKDGRIIHPVVNNRTKNVFQFAPAFPVVSTQKIEIKYDRYPTVFIDSKRMPRTLWPVLASNDGFNSTEKFFNWFNTDFKGTIIHWTDFRY
jgi:hypothetical protein